MKPVWRHGRVRRSVAAITHPRHRTLAGGILSGSMEEKRSKPHVVTGSRVPWRSIFSDSVARRPRPQDQPNGTSRSASSNADIAARVNANQYGSVRKEWRAFIEYLHAYPSLQRFALEAASFFTKPSEIEFELPRTFHQEYVLAEKLGEGAFGQVHRVVPVVNDGAQIDYSLDLAVKIVPKKLVVNLKDYTALQQEGKMMVLLGGTLNVVHFFGAYEDDASVYLVMEHCVGGDASERLRDGSPKNEPLVALYMTDILHVVWQCHLLRILHGDLKLENFLFADAKERSPLKLTDFGGAAFLAESEILHEVRGTPLYTAPEVLQGKYSLPSDMWSCGVILYRLLSGRFPFEEGPLLDERILHEQIDLEVYPWSAISQDAKDLVSGLLNRDADARLTADQALKHPWFASALRSPRSDESELHPPRSPPTTPLLNGTMVQRLQLYRALNSFQQVVFSEIARILPLELKEEVVVLFSEISRHGATQVGIDEFATYLEQGGYRLTFGEVKSFLSRLDLNGDGLLALDEFCAAFLDWSVIQTQFPAQWSELVGTIFATLDDDKDGQLSLDDLARMAPFAGHRKATHSFRSDIKRCFRQADLNANGWIDRDEFESMLRIQVQAYAHFAQRLS